MASLLRGTNRLATSTLRATRQSSAPIRSKRHITSVPLQRSQVPDYPPSISPGHSDVERASGHERRRQTIADAKPFSEFLTDTFHRQHDYLRISVTERCNLRCLYCMPEEGVSLSPAAHILTSPEIFYLSALFVSQGVTKIRLTGGEPTVRKDIVPLMKSIGSLRSRGLRELALTTNGISLHRKLDSMVEAGLTGVNLSLDTLDPFQYQIMTRRNGFEAVLKSINRILEMKKAGVPIRLKINCVVMRGLNEREIIPFVELGKDKDVEVRFIEYMPFGGNKWSKGKMVSYQEMLDIIHVKYPGLQRLRGHRNDTSKTYQVPGFQGRVGFITSMTHNFCGTCNRLRITSDGNLKVCLHGNAEVSLRDILREGNDGNPIDEAAFEALKKLDHQNACDELSNATPLGWGERERNLLEIIGSAVKRKKEKHAGMGELENMTNRPMILIDPKQRRELAWDSVRANGVLSWYPFLPHMVSSHHISNRQSMRCFSSTSRPSDSSKDDKPETPSLPHLTAAGEAHMVSVTDKPATSRRAIATGFVSFSSASTLPAIRDALIKKGDVLGTARLAGIMAAKHCPSLIPLCHPIVLSAVNVDVSLIEPKRQGLEHGGVLATAEVQCVGQTGVEMEALTSVTGSLLTVIDMVKAVDKGTRMQDVKMVLKEGGRSGRWVDPSWQGESGR